MAVKAKIRWLPPEEGGKKPLPKNVRYSTVAKFDFQSFSDWEKEAWSVVLRTEESATDNFQHATVWFLSPKAPSHWLSSGKRFDLYEGRRKVAEGIVD